MALTRIVISTPLTATQDLANVNLNGTGSWHNIKRLLYWLEGFSKGARRGNMLVKVGAVKASGTITFTSTGPANDEVGFLLSKAVTAKTTVSDPLVEFQRSNTVSVAAANLAAMINASSTFNPYLTATASLGVVTVSAAVPGVLGNAYTFGNYTWANTVYSGSSYLAGGSDGTAYSLTLGQLIA